MFLQRLYQDDLAQASYLVGCQATGEALVVDPHRSIEHYLDAAEKQGLQITAITETHIHADFVSGARELALKTGAQVYLSGAGPAEWQYAWADQINAISVHDGDSWMVGNVRIDVLHTPGHTPEHISFMLTDTATTNLPMGVFTGDFVFVGDVGRPDLLERAAGVVGTMELGARDLFASIQRFKQLPDYVQIWPGHGAGSACGKALGAIPQTTLGYEKATSWAFQVDTEAEFVTMILNGQPDAPTYFAQMKKVNKIGPELRPTQAPKLFAAEDFEVAMQRYQVVDTRSIEDFAQAPTPQALNLPADNGFLNWAGWLINYHQPIALIVEPTQVERLTHLLHYIGLDNVQGFWNLAQLQMFYTQPIESLSAAQAQSIYESDTVEVLDVRTQAEYRTEHIPGSYNIPLGQLPNRIAELDPEKCYLVYCQGGLRSAIATSLLTAHNFKHLINLTDGFSAWKAADYAVEEGVSTYAHS